jgi:hypothetical protein
MAKSINTNKLLSMRSELRQRLIDNASVFENLAANKAQTDTAINSLRGSAKLNRDIAKAENNEDYLPDMLQRIKDNIRLLQKRSKSGCTDFAQRIKNIVEENQDLITKAKEQAKTND